MRIFLTGGSGFIGRNILESSLSEKHLIAAPSHAELDLSDEDAVHRYVVAGKFDAVIHAAAKAGHRAAKDPSGVFFTNTRIFFNLARNADWFGQMITIGSGAVYDMRYYVPRMCEEHFDSHVPTDEHGLNKYVIQKFIEGKPKFMDLRVFGIFGKYEEYSIRFISNMICKALFDLPLTIKQNRRFSYLDVSDLVPILEHFLRRPAAYSAYNATPDEIVELVDIAKLVISISGRDLPLLLSKDGLGSEYTGSNARLRSEMQFLTFARLSDSVERLYSWYAGRTALIDRSLLIVDK